MMKVTYLGHASFKIECRENVVYIDPWLTGPTSPMKVDDVEKADIVLVTHDHGDHGYAEAIEICKKTGAYFVAINELGIQAKGDGVENVHTLNIGGSVEIGDINVTLVHAFHSCGKGAPTGFIAKFPCGTVYHPGDTGVFSDMRLFGEMYGIDLFLSCIGSYYVMDEHQAAMATKLVNPKVVIPMHYDTFPVIKADTEDFRNKVSQAVKDVKVEIMKPGESIELKF
ncbi:MAG: metal-dependent hydrolase [Candidatus Thorarchaeota archaeon]|nr:MAG: metal-dependent hydrolase [Candidatus Thorarchaeota archaeon]